MPLRVIIAMPVTEEKTGLLAIMVTLVVIVRIRNSLDSQCHTFQSDNTLNNPNQAER